MGRYELYPSFNLLPIAQYSSSVQWKFGHDGALFPPLCLMEPYKYLKERSHYEERYDRSTVELGREYDHDIDLGTEVIPRKGNRREMTLHAVMPNPVLKEILLTRFDEREKTISEWMERDQKRDEALENTPEPRVMCLKCNTRLDCFSRDFSPDANGVIFRMGCLPCHKTYRVSETGYIFPRKRITCVKCKKTTHSSVEENGNITVFIDTCIRCGHAERTVIEDKPKPQETEIERNRYERDKKVYCWTHREKDLYLGWIAHVQMTLEYVASERFVEEREKEKTTAVARRAKKRK